MDNKNFVKIAETIIPMSAILKVEQAEDGQVTLCLNEKRHEFAGEKAREVWKVFSDMSIELPSPEEPNFEWMKNC